VTALPFSVTAQGQIGRLISYQGRLEGVTGGVTLRFQIYDATAAVVWGPELHIVTPDAEGRFVAVVGNTGRDVDPADGIPDLDQIAAEELELEVAIDDGSGSMNVLSPRQRLFPAFHASSATHASRADVAGEVDDEAVTLEKIAQGVRDSRLMQPGDVLLRFGSTCPPGFSKGPEGGHGDFKPHVIGLDSGVQGGLDTYWLAKTASADRVELKVRYVTICKKL
jgi:hypothetical protein